MKLINTVNANLRYAATLLSQLKDETKSIRIVESKDAYTLSLDNGLSFSLEILDGDDNTEFDSEPFYVNAKYMGTALNSCVTSDVLAFYKQDGKLRIGAFMNTETKQFAYESEFEMAEPFVDVPFEQEDITFSMTQTDIIEMFGMCDMFDNIDICRKNGVVSYRASNGKVTVVTRYTMSNLGNKVSVPDFKINIGNEVLKLLSFVGLGEVSISLDVANKTLKASDGSITVISKYEDNKYETISFTDGDAKFVAPKGVFSKAVKDLCGSLSSAKKNDIYFQHIKKKTIAVEWKRKGMGEISILTAVDEAKRFKRFKVKADVLQIAIACSEDSSIMVAETENKQNVILCRNERYLRKILF